jgi:multidrug resistance efflux pump
LALGSPERLTSRLRQHSARAADRRGVARKDRAVAARKIRSLAAERKVDVLTIERAKAAAQLDRARAVEQQMALNLSYTTIAAPVAGTIGARSLRVGHFVQAGTQLMAVLPLNAVYVVANFKETQRGIIKACWIVLSLFS